MKIYVAGKLNAEACEYNKNIHKMIIESEKIRKLGFSVYVPCLDFLTGVVSGNLNYKDYFNNSQPWLEVSDAIYVMSNWKSSKGTKREINRAKKKNIPIFYNLKDLIKWKNEKNKKI